MRKLVAICLLFAACATGKEPGGSGLGDDDDDDPAPDARPPTPPPIDASVPIDAFVPIDAPGTGGGGGGGGGTGFCNTTSDCTEAGTCCFTFGTPPGICVPGEEQFGVCLPE